LPLSSDVRRRRLVLPGSGLGIALLDWGGSGPLALLHHANGFCAALWAGVAESLRGRFRVVAMDARGHGDSDRPEGPEAYRWDRFAEDAAGVARSLAAESGEGRVPLAVGNSFGGTALVAAAARAPELFGRVVVVDPVLLPPAWHQVPPERRTQGSRLAQGARRRRARFASRAEAREAWAGRSLFSRWQPRALDLYVEEGLRDEPDGGVALKCDPEVEARVFEAAGAFDVFELAPRVTCPVLVLWAAGGTFERALHERFAAALPHGRFQVLDAGHLAPMEDPERVVAAVCAGDASQGGVG